MSQQTWKIEITMSVDDSWVADGFDLKDRVKAGQIAEWMTKLLPFATGSEVQVKAKVLAAPDPKVIKALQTGTMFIFQRSSDNRYFAGTSWTFDERRATRYATKAAAIAEARRFASRGYLIEQG